VHCHAHCRLGSDEYDGWTRVGDQLKFLRAFAEECEPWLLPESRPDVKEFKAARKQTTQARKTLGRATSDLKVLMMEDDSLSRASSVDSDIGELAKAEEAAATARSEYRQASKEALSRHPRAIIAI
jgi:hypothetical protein